MRFSHPAIIALATLFVFSILAFFRPDLLVYPALSEPYVPLGTVTSWIALLFPSLISFLIFRKNFNIIPLYFQVMIFLGLLLGIPWGIVGRILSGNWAFEFVNIPASSQRFWLYTYATAAIQFFVLVAIPLLAMWVRKKGTKEG